MTTFTPTQAADLFRSPPARHLDVGAGEVAHRRIGTGPDVLFVHGWPVTGATFRTLLPHLVDHVTCHVIDLPGTGSSRFDGRTPLSIRQHVESVRRTVDLLGLDDVAVVGHDSGGLIARHAMVDDARLRAMGLLDTELPGGLGWRFRSFLAARRLPAAGAVIGWASGKPAVRRNKFVFGDAFVDRSLLDGEFDELLLRPLRTPAGRDAAGRLFASFDYAMVDELTEIHRRLDVPVHLVWGAVDPFFPVDRVRTTLGLFPDARLTVIEGASLFCHEERPAEVAAALLPTLLG